MAYIYTSQVEAPHPFEVSETDSLHSTETDNSNQLIDNETKTEHPASLSSLVGSSWMWSGIYDSSSRQTFTPHRPEAFMLQFTDGRMSSRTDCNTIGASYATEANQITFGEVMSTLMFCENSDESIYTSSLADVVSFKEQDSQLYLYMSDGSFLIFKSRIPY
jgi:heat shock protein HslJ